MSKKLRLIMGALIAVAPTSSLRILLLRAIFGYSIKNSTLGFGTIMVVHSATVHSSRIGPFNLFLGPLIANLCGVTIGFRNRFTCGDWVLDPKVSKPGYTRTLTLRSGVLVTDHHHFDVCASILVGENTWIAGTGSQFWTHGAGRVADIVIGSNCYVGSAARFSSGAGLGDNVMLGIGSVVTKRIAEDNCLVAGVPARVLRSNYNWRNEEGQ